MEDYTAMQLYDLQRKSSLEICKRMLKGEVNANQIDIFCKLTVDIKTPVDEKSLTEIVQKSLTQELEASTFALSHNTTLDVTKCHISRTVPVTNR
jgi:hypothetical protein